MAPERGPQRPARPSAGRQVGAAGAGPREDTKQRNFRRFRGSWDLLETLWRVSSIERVRKCRRVSRTADGSASIGLRQGVALLSGTTTCGSHSCPFCSQRIRATRANEEIVPVIRSVVDQGGAVGHLVVTTGHARGWSTTAQLEVLQGVWHAVMNARGVEAGLSAAGYDGYVRGLDHTYGPNGPHGHYHALVALQAGHDADHIEALRQEMTAAADRYLERMGLPPLHPVHGISFELLDVDEGVEELAGYIVKPDAPTEALDEQRAAWEVAGGRTKRGNGEHRTPWEVLADFSEWGEARDLAIWGEYERAMVGKRQVVWSRNGFKSRHLGHDEERTDEEIAQETDDDVVLVAPIAGDQLHAITSVRGRVPHLLTTVTAAAAGGEDQARAAVAALFNDWGLGPPRRDRTDE